MQKLWTIFLFAGLISCHSTKKEEGVLSQPQLTALLIDVYVAEARIDQLRLSRDSAIHFFLPFEEKLLKRRGISDEMLKKTHTYYVNHPKELEMAYDAAIDSLALREQRLVRNLHQGPK